MTALAIKDLSVAYGGRVAVDHLSLEIAPGEVVALVGESGSGKSTVAAAATGLLPQSASADGEIWIGSSRLDTLSEAERNGLRGRQVAMIFQEPLTALNPIMTVQAQVAESLAVHFRLSRAEARARATESLSRVGLSAAQAMRYPQQLSGGQRQRAALAMAVAAAPSLLIADEPTTALDVTIQAEILRLLRRLVDEEQMGLLLISHDLALVAQVADRVLVMKSGGVAEEGHVRQVLAAPTQDYTKHLLARARFERAEPPSRGPARPALLEVHNVIHGYRSGWGKGLQTHRALDDVSFTIGRGETVGIIGESGAGKTSLLRTVLALERPQRGDVQLGGTSILHARGAELRRLRRQVQAVFQDPAASLDPRQRVERIVAEPLSLLDRRFARDERRAKVERMLERVGLSAADADRYPNQFSGGQRQRIAIARALIIEPSLVVLDEAVSALDASIRADVLALLSSLSKGSRVSYLFVSHDLSMIRQIADRLIVMREGRIVEQGRTEDIVSAPSDPYTASLLAATPDLNRALAAWARRA